MRFTTRLATFLCLLTISPFSFARLDVLQSKQTVQLSEPARQALQSALPKSVGTDAHVLPQEPAAAVIESLPAEFGRSCNEMLQNWGQGAPEAAHWSVRVLYSFRNEAETAAILALRCSSSAVDNAYDERPAIVSLSSASATLTLVPLADDCSNCSELYGVEFSQVFAAEGARLVELMVSYSSDNPCCGGPDSKDGNRRMILVFPLSQPASAGKSVLTLDDLTDWFSGDATDPAGGTNGVCRTEFNYARDPAGNVNAIATDTHCTENGKPTPGANKSTYKWNHQALRFDESK